MDQVFDGWEINSMIKEKYYYLKMSSFSPRQQKIDNDIVFKFVILLNIVLS